MARICFKTLQREEGSGWEYRDRTRLIGQEFKMVETE